MKILFVLFLSRLVLSTVCADEVMQTALKAIGLQEADLAVANLTLDDPDRLPITREILAHPRRVNDVATILMGEGADTALLWAVDLLGVGGDDKRRADRAKVESFDDLVRELKSLRAQVQTLFEGFDDSERALLKTMLDLVDPGVQMSESRKDSMIALGRQVSLGKLAQIAQRLVGLGNRVAKREIVLTPGRFETSAGLIIIGTESDDVYADPAILIVDPGGDDRYQSVAGVSLDEFPISLCVDLAGADVYAGMQGMGALGIGVVIDLVGNDRYEGAGAGCGIVGVGIVDDRAGDDVYHSSVGGQGFGLYGVGVLCDGAGNDRFTGGHLVQGAAGPGGVGVLLDGAGDDVYDAGNYYRDFREEGVFFQSMAQGFGRGVRPLTSGGVGVLVDNKGHDVYRVDYFGQGAAFWGGSGVLIDREGDDRFTARRYAQGTGVHVSVGVLMDLLGNDHYEVWGVGQGCGHDLSVGVLHDLAGDDVYRASWLSQGVGSANGFGWLDDHLGNDRYVVEREDTQGYGVLSRDYGSIGLFIDRWGLDEYEGRGAAGMLWRGGQYGVGIDWPLQGVDNKE